MVATRPTRHQGRSGAGQLSGPTVWVMVVSTMNSCIFLRSRPLARRLIAISLVWLGSALPAAANECPAQIRVAYTDAELPPYVLGEGSAFQEPPGLFVAWTRAALQKLGCMAVVSETRLPYNRIVSSMAAGIIDIRVTGGYRSDVADIMRFPMRNGSTNRAMAVAEANTRLYVLKNAPTLAWDGTTLRFTGPNPAIGTVRGHYTEKLIEAQKWATDSAPNWDSNAKKLLMGRVAAIVGPDSVVDALPERGQMQMLDPPIQYDLYFAPVSKQFHAKYPDFTERFWLEICRQSRATFTRLPACALR